MSGLLGYLVLFVLVGVGFVFVHLMIGKLIRPSKPDPDKLTIYECGEPTIGSAWVQFDLRFYVVVLLVGFAYLWSRGDLKWVRSLAAEDKGPAPPVPANGAAAPPGRALAGAGS